MRNIDGKHVRRTFHERKLETHFMDPGNNLPAWFNTKFSSQGNGKTIYHQPDTAGYDGVVEMVVDNEVRGLSSHPLPEKAQLHTLATATRVAGVGLQSPDYFALALGETNTATRKGGVEVRLYKNSQAEIVTYDSNGNKLNTQAINFVYNQCTLTLQLEPRDGIIKLRERDNILWKAENVSYGQPAENDPWYAKVYGDATANGSKDTIWDIYASYMLGYR